MAKDIKINAITPMETDFARWYTDIVKHAELIEYTSVKGCIILRPYAYAIWELIQKNLDDKFKKTGHQNVYMPLLIPESLLQKESDHVEGFAPEVAIVTIGGNEQLTERLIIRPTSETLFCEHYKNIIQSHRDLPKLYNQWCSVIRWEKTTRPFLRTSEFLWQEGHTAHATEDEAREETLNILNLYDDFCKDFLAIPMVKGRKTEKEKFAGAKETYSIESLMHDGKGLQSGTSHYFGDGFAKAFDITYTDKNNKLQHVFQTSWGVSTRLLGALIMVHGDNNGLVLPPNIAPIQTIIIPIAQNKAGVLDKANELKQKLESKFRVSIDDSDKTPGWKYSEAELKGIPIRIELGPKDIENNQCVLVRRDNREKFIVCLDNVLDEVDKLLKNIQDSLYNKAFKHLEEHTHIATSIDMFEDILINKTGYIKAMWCGCEQCELEIKNRTGATSRCIPFEQEDISDTCIVCGEKAKHMVMFAKSY